MKREWAVAYFESFILQNFFDGHNFACGGCGGLEHHSKRSVSDDAVDDVGHPVALHCVPWQDLASVSLVL